MTKRMIAPLLIGVLGAAILLSLGVWQLNRLTWKQAILAEIEAQVTAAPVTLAEIGDPEDAQFVPVRLSGRFTGEELHVLSSTRDYGAVYRIIAAFETADNRRVLVDRGIIPLTSKDTPRPTQTVTIVANIRTPVEVDSYTPDPDPIRNIWFARDVPVMATALKTEPLMLILRETSETPLVVRPHPVDIAGIPNNHLNYVITWFLFAAAWLGMTGLWLWRIRRRTQL